MLDLLPDLFDLYPEQLQLAEPLFNDYGGKVIFFQVKLLQYLALTIIQK